MSPRFCGGMFCAPCIVYVGEDESRGVLALLFLQTEAEGVPEAVAVYVATADLLAVGGPFGRAAGRRCR